MFCPVCRDEFRPGFTRCRACDVDLVESLDGPAPAATPEPVIAVQATPPPAARAAHPHEQAVNYCGFLTLEDARHAVAQLRDEGVPAEILIRYTADGHEEFWLRVRPSDFRATQALLGYDETSVHDEDTVLCASCGTLVPASDDRCPSCGARLEVE